MEYYEQLCKKHNIMHDQRGCRLCTERTNRRKQQAEPPKRDLTQDEMAFIDDHIVRGD